VVEGWGTVQPHSLTYSYVKRYLQTIAKSTRPSVAQADYAYLVDIWPQTYPCLSADTLQFLNHLVILLVLLGDLLHLLLLAGGFLIRPFITWCTLLLLSLIYCFRFLLLYVFNKLLVLLLRLLGGSLGLR
jgi:hypothetical protein